LGRKIGKITKPESVFIFSTLILLRFELSTLSNTVFLVTAYRCYIHRVPLSSKYGHAIVLDKDGHNGLGNWGRGGYTQQCFYHCYQGTSNRITTTSEKIPINKQTKL